MTKGTTIIAGDILLMDGHETRAEAMAWRDGLITAVGTLEEVQKHAPHAAVIDLGDKTVLPGFIDAHHHASIVAMYTGAIQLGGAQDIPELQNVLAEAAQRQPPGTWLVAAEWDELKLKERRPPTLAELNEAVPDHPLFAMHFSCHRAAANSLGLAQAGIDAQTPQPMGGEIVKSRSGRPTGLLIERGMSRIETIARASLVAMDAEGFFARLSAHYKKLVAAGITRVADCTVPGDVLTLYQQAERDGLLLIPTVAMPVSTTGYLETPWDALEGPPTGQEQGNLIIGPLKLVFDGAPGCAMCLSWWQLFGVSMRGFAMAIRQRSFDSIRNMLSVQPRVGLKIRTGIRIYPQQEARKFIAAAAERDFGVAVHAIGNEAIEVAIDAYSHVGVNSLHNASMPRIEHATFLSSEAADRLADLGAAVVVQPHFMSLPAFACAPAIPAMRNSPLRWLMDRGVLVAGSSDYPVAGFNPLDGIQAATQRLTSRGEVYEADQRITLEEALLLYTKNAAVAMSAGDVCGTLAVGKRADIVVLDKNLHREGIECVKVETTLVGGEVMFGDLPASRSAPVLCH